VTDRNFNSEGSKEQNKRKRQGEKSIFACFFNSVHDFSIYCCIMPCSLSLEGTNPLLIPHSTPLFLLFYETLATDFRNSIFLTYIFNTVLSAVCLHRRYRNSSRFYGSDAHFKR
jgi:hypothetical protein